MIHKIILNILLKDKKNFNVHLLYLECLDVAKMLIIKFIKIKIKMKKKLAKLLIELKGIAL